MRSSSSTFPLQEESGLLQDREYSTDKGIRKGMPLPDTVRPSVIVVWEGHPLAGALDFATALTRGMRKY